MIRLRSGRSTNGPEEELASAWGRYLRSIRAADDDEYDEVEEIAWRRLHRELATLDVVGDGRRDA
jgi:hypothetical protein